jgi:O-methyltransferase
VRNFKHANLKLPIIHKAWFDDLTASDIPDSIAFAFLDGDYYASIMTSLRLITPHLSPGACIVVDDYQSSALPGARKAVDEWARAHTYSCRSEQSLAILRMSP